MQKRILSFDVARSLAILGMIFVNYRLVLGEPKNPHWLYLLFYLIEGKAAATFFTLAGVGIALMTRRWTEETFTYYRKKILRRALFLFVIGLLYSPIWPADILHFYGLYMVVGAFVFHLSGVGLLLLAIFFTWGFVFLVILFDYSEGWNFETLEYADFWTVKGMIRHLFFNGFHPVFPWVAFLLVGLWLGRKDLFNKKTRVRVLVLGVILVAISSAVSVVGNELGGDWVYILGTQPLPPFPFFIVIGVGTAFIVITLCFWLNELVGDLEWLAETGQLSLTNYVLHVVVGLGILFGLGVTKASLWFVFWYSIGFFIFLVIGSHVWRKRFSRGPLEWVMRKLTG